MKRDTRLGWENLDVEKLSDYKMAIIFGNGVFDRIKDMPVEKMDFRYRNTNQKVRVLKILKGISEVKYIFWSFGDYELDDKFCRKNSIPIIGHYHGERLYDSSILFDAQPLFLLFFINWNTNINPENGRQIGLNHYETWISEAYDGGTYTFTQRKMIEMANSRGFVWVDGNQHYQLRWSFIHLLNKLIKKTVFI